MALYLLRMMVASARPITELLMTPYIGHVLTPYIGHLDQYMDNSDLRSHFDERRAIESLEGKSISWRCSSGANRPVLA